MQKSVTRFSGSNFGTLFHVFAAMCISLTTASAQTFVNPVTNPNFEQSQLTDGQTAEPLPTGYGWTATGAVGLARYSVATSTNRIVPPMGRQWNGTAIAQTVNLTAAAYNLSMSAMQCLGSGRQLPQKATLGNANYSQIPQDLYNAPPLLVVQATNHEHGARGTGQGARGKV